MAHAAGIGRSTLQRWLAEGEAGNGQFRDFWDTIKKGEAEWELEQTLSIRQVAQGGDLVARTTTCGNPKLRPPP